MNREAYGATLLAIGAFSLMLFVVPSTECMAQEEEQQQEQPVAKEWSRAGKMEIYGLVQYMRGDTVGKGGLARLGDTFFVDKIDVIVYTMQKCAMGGQPAHSAFRASEVKGV